jgi:succinate dehydrogenase/fumarate reductase-like Fe-S protein
MLQVLGDASLSVATGNAVDGNSILVSKELSDKAMDAAACIGCGACVAAWALPRFYRLSRLVSSATSSAA